MPRKASPTAFTTDIPEFRLSTQFDDGRAVVYVGGELDIQTAPELQDCLLRLIDGGAVLITVDVSGVDFIDSTGIHTLVSSLKLVQERAGKMQLRSPQPHTYKVLEMVGLAEIIPIV